MSFNQTPSAPGTGNLNVPGSAYEQMSPLPYETVEQPYQVLQGPMNQQGVYQTVQRDQQQPLPGSSQMVANQNPHGVPQQQATPSNVQPTQFRQTSIQPMTMPTQQQPVFSQQPAGPSTGTGGGPVIYYVAQPQPGMGQVAMHMAPQAQSDFEYKPKSYRMLSILTLIFCGIFSPLSVVCSFPALIFSLKSEKSLKAGLTKRARKNGTMAAYLIVFTVIFAMVTATIITGAVMPSAIAIRCINSGSLSNTNIQNNINRYGPSYLGYCYY